MTNQKTERRMGTVPGTAPVMLCLKHLRIIAALCMAFAISACGGGSSTAPSTTIAFSASSPGSNSVYMAQNTSLTSGSSLAVDVKVEGVSNVYGAAFDVDFDSSKMSYIGYSAGSFLEQDGNTVNYQAATQSGNSGKLIVAAARQGSVAGATGSGTLITLKFNVTGGTALLFGNNALKDPSDNTIAATWSSGGTVTVN